LEAGKQYRYRLRVKMANPNYSSRPKERKDTQPQFAREQELVSEWTEVPQTLVVPPDSVVYAVDQKYVQPKLPPRQARNDPNPSREVAVQIQRWVDFYRPRPEIDAKEGVGDWVIANRVFVSRGEYLRTRTHRAAIPVKPLSVFEYVLDEKSLIKFGDKSILVDFEGGRLAHERLTPTGRMIMTEQAPMEILMMSPDGRVQARNELVDARDPERKARYADYLKRVQEIKDRKEGEKSPFGK
jgi:hypothetical protein